MKIKGKFAAKVAKLLTKSNKANDGSTAEADFEVSVKRDDGGEMFGDDFDALAFSSRIVNDVDGVESIGYLQDSVTPGKRVLFEDHAVNIGGESIIAKPQMLKVVPVDGEDRAVVTLRLPIETKNTALLTELLLKVGQDVALEFDPAQLDLDLDDSNRNRTP
ncbi:MAG: hypothetical protein KAJ19_18885 [Gammaproteobacteria bacterium]|nr:hypothetical protein [Gammaproteobacteria bacterium]